MTKFENFNKTLRNLEEMNRVNPPYDVVVTARLCSLFAQCFEQAWRAMKEYLTEGVSHAEGMERGGNRFSQADIKDCL